MNKDTHDGRQNTYVENLRVSNAKLTENWGWTRVLRKDPAPPVAEVMLLLDIIWYEYCAAYQYT